MRTSALVMVLLAAAAIVGSRPLSSQSRALEIAAAFSKHKSVVKEAHGVRREKYKDIRSEPTVRQHIRDYSGVYDVAELGYSLNVQVSDDGTVRASGSDGDAQRRGFELANAKLQGSLLTGTRVFRDGTTEKFEAVFLTRTDRNSPTDPGSVLYGLGVLLPASIELRGNAYDKLFYQLRQ